MLSMIETRQLTLKLIDTLERESDTKKQFQTAINRAWHILHDVKRSTDMILDD